MKTRNAYSILAAGTILLMYSLHYLLDLIPFVEKAPDKLEDWHKEQLGILIERSKLVSGLASAVFGVAGGLLIKLGSRATTRLKRKAIYVFILAGASLLFGYLSFSEVIWMLDSEFFNLYSLSVRAPFDAQFVLFLAAVLIRGHLFLMASERLDTDSTYSPRSTQGPDLKERGQPSEHPRTDASAERRASASPSDKPASHTDKPDNEPGGE